MMQPFIAGLLTAGFMILCIVSTQKVTAPPDDCGLDWLCLISEADAWHPPKKHHH
jgi:hypothetical protein